MAKQSKPVREFAGKKILNGTWKERKIEYVSGEIIISIKKEYRKILRRAKGGASQEFRKTFFAKLPKTIKVIEDFNADGRLRIELPDRINILNLAKKLERDPMIEYAEPNLIHQEGLTPVIPNEYINLATLGMNQWGLQNARVPWAWSVSTGNSQVLLAIIDSGIAGPERFPGAVYRWYNSSLGDHFYCLDPMGEAAHGGGYNFESTPFALFPNGTPNTTPFYRFLIQAANDHFYTTDMNGEGAPGLSKEGTLGNIAMIKIAGSTELFRLYNPALNNHFYTTDVSEKNTAKMSGYLDEGTAGFVTAPALGRLSHRDLADGNRIHFGRDYIHNDNFPVDDRGHGTIVTGIASADTNNSIDIAGVCWNCEVLVIKILDTAGNGIDSNFADAIREAVDFGAARGKKVVINYSGGAMAPSQTMEDAVDYARRRDCLIVSISHNDSDRGRIPTPLLNPLRWPAAYSANYDNVIAVGSIDINNNIANTSNEGPELNVVAPGVGIRSTITNYSVTLNAPGNTGFGSGTSFAAPHVSGLAALLLSADNRLSAKRVREIIETTATHMGTPGRNNTFGFGRINCEKAMEVLMGGTIFRWSNPVTNDHFYTPDPTGELAPALGYKYEGAPFRLFPLNTAGTTIFYRWLNGQINDHFYTSDPAGELAPGLGYVLEGSIGNIATSQITGTVPLFRWLNAQTNDHFYTTAADGELAPVSGYIKEGIAGFVIPL